MDRLHTVLRSLRAETKTDRKHLDVFREFLTHLAKINRKASARPPGRTKAASRSKSSTRRKGTKRATRG